MAYHAPIRNISDEDQAKSLRDYPDKSSLLNGTNITEAQKYVIQGSSWGPDNTFDFMYLFLNGTPTTSTEFSIAMSNGFGSVHVKNGSDLMKLIQGTSYETGNTTRTQFGQSRLKKITKERVYIKVMRGTDVVWKVGTFPINDKMTGGDYLSNLTKGGAYGESAYTNSETKDGQVAKTMKEYKYIKVNVEGKTFYVLDNDTNYSTRRLTISSIKSMFSNPILFNDFHNNIVSELNNFREYYRNTFDKETGRWTNAREANAYLSYIVDKVYSKTISRLPDDPGFILAFIDPETNPEKGTGNIDKDKQTQKTKDYLENAENNSRTTGTYLDDTKKENTKTDPEKDKPDETPKTNEPSEKEIREKYVQEELDELEKTLMKNEGHDRSTEYTGPINPDDYMKVRTDVVKYGSEIINNLFTPMQTFGVGGMPASFLTTTDPPRYDGKHMGLGVVYMENYIRYGQYIAFVPSVARYRLGFENMFKKGITDGISKAVSGAFQAIATGNMATLVTKKYEYWLQVSRLNRIAIHLMGLEKRVFSFQQGAIKLGRLTGDKATRDSNATADYYGIKNYEFGRIGGDTWCTIGAGFANIVGNTSGVNMSLEGFDYSSKFLDGTDDDEDKEAEKVKNDFATVVFLTDGGIKTGVGVQNQIGDNGVATAFQQMLGTTDLQGFLGSVLSTQTQSTGDGMNLANYLTGKFMIPKVWNGAQAEDRSYSFDLKFTSSSGDEESVFLNVIYPLNKIFALALPEATGGLMFSPWIVSVYSTGSINIDFGMITNISVQKNIMNMTDRGLPTEVSVSVTVEDLKPFFYMEKPTFWSHTSKQSGAASNVIATLIGANITTIPVHEKIQFRAQMARLNNSEKADDLGKSIKIAINRVLGRMRIAGYSEYTNIKGKIFDLKDYFTFFSGGSAFQNAADNYNGNR